MPLTQERRTQLDGIVQKMDANGASSDEIKAIVNDFTGKFGAEQPPPSGAKGFFGAAAENLIPEVIRHPSMLKEVPGAISDLSAQLPSPAAIPGAVTGQFLKDVHGAASQASEEQFAKGNTLGGIGAAVPLIGPPAAQAGEEIGRGETARGLGHAAGMLAPFAVGPLAKAATKVTAPLGEAAAGETVNALIKPLEREFRFGRDPGMGLAKEGLVAPTLGRLAIKVDATRGLVGKQIENLLNTPAAQTKLIDIEPLTAPLDAAIAKATRVGDKALASRLTEIKGSPLLTDKTLVTPAEAAEIKSVLGETTRWTGEAFEKDLNQARAAVYRNLNDAIDQAVPGVKALNARYADLLSAAKSIERTKNIQSRAAPLNLMDVATTGAGLMAGHGAAPALAGAALRRFGATTGPMTAAAQVLRGVGAEGPTVAAGATRSLGLAARANRRAPAATGRDGDPNSGR